MVWWLLSAFICMPVNLARPRPNPVLPLAGTYAAFSEGDRITVARLDSLDGAPIQLVTPLHRRQHIQSMCIVPGMLGARGRARKHHGGSTPPM